MFFVLVVCVCVCVCVCLLFGGRGGRVVLCPSSVERFLLLVSCWKIMGIVVTNNEEIYTKLKFIQNGSRGFIPGFNNHD